MSFKYSIPKRRSVGQVYSQEALYREYYPIIMKMLMVRGRGIMDAEDIAHDTFVYMFGIWKSIKWETVENLLSLILYQSVVRYYRQNDQDNNITGGTEFIELVDSDLVQDPFETIVLDDFRKTLQDAMSTLSKGERDTFFGFYLENKSVDDLKGSRHKGTVHRLLYTSRIKVSDFFKKHYTRD